MTEQAKQCYTCTVYKLYTVQHARHVEKDREKTSKTLKHPNIKAPPNSFPVQVQVHVTTVSGRLAHKKEKENPSYLEEEEGGGAATQTSLETSYPSVN